MKRVEKGWITTVKDLEILEFRKDLEIQKTMILLVEWREIIVLHLRHALSYNPLL